MKPLIWLVFAIAAALWTLSAWGMASLIEWGLPLLASGDTLQIETAVRSLAMPAWLAIWVDAAWWQLTKNKFTGRNFDQMNRVNVCVNR